MAGFRPLTWLFLIMALIGLTACTPQVPSPTPLGTTSIPSPTLLPPTSISIEPTLTPWIFPSGLVIEEHPLRNPPSIEPLSFEPLTGTFDQIMARHADLRANVIQHNTLFDPQENAFGLWTPWQGQRLEVVTKTNSVNQVMAEVRLGNQVIYTLPLGQPGALSQVQGVWAQGDSWIAEVVYLTCHSVRTGERQSVECQPRGLIIQNGEVLNERYGYEEAFGFQWLNGKPFYFFQKSGWIGICYHDQEIPLRYDEIPHYRCCSAAELNPVHAAQMVAFFARRGEQWYYVEAGLFTPAQQ
ncbi:MAG: hypothetical protein ACPLUL_11900 [Thermanaerothrix sp.]|uniref:hypothetical protein n=1 Tax=Thermanaerothrix sp. TaxID=2972675 RepID=UPI003C7BA388